ncbi:MAG: hypothetical protein OEW75_00940, partial [Cyclobacteriaceae bacterium]|nr:hypothetical protein [Cyclobacteriaceae bacterium]
DILGLIIFALYILAPFYLIVNRYSKTRTTLPGKEIHLNSSNSVKILVVFLFLVSLTLLLNKKEINENIIPPHENSILGYKQSTLDGNILKYTNENTLIYIKPPVSFYKADHNPLICWEGSGYSFRKVDTIVIKGIEIYFAELEKDGDKLYTSWWFQHQNQITNNQWEWRWNTLKSDYAYNMVNVTASTFQEMKTTAEMMMMTVETQ